MKKKYFIACLLMTFSFINNAQTVLAPNDIAITGFNSDNPDQLSFVLLTDVTPTTAINFTDNGWFAIGGFRLTEGTLTWSTSTNLGCGTEIIIGSTVTGWTVNIGTVVETDIGFAPAIDGDQILAFQGDPMTPSFIFGVTMDSSGWSDATSANTSALPPALTDGVNAISFGEIDNATYACSVTNGTAAILAAILNPANWTLSNSNLVVGGCSYNCIVCANTAVWNGGWVPNAPDNTYEVTIAADYNSTLHGGSFEACRLNVNAAATLSILNTDYVLVENDINIDGTILIGHEGSIVQVNDFSNVTLNGAGNGIVQKTATPQDYYSYTYWSSPFVNEIIGEPGSGMDLVPSARIFEYNASNFEDVSPVDGFDDNSNDWSIASGPMIPGKGYAAFAQSSFMAFPQFQTYNFDGQFNNGEITTVINTSVAPGDPNWNLLGNPYPSGIDADTFVANNPDVDGTIYLWTHNSPPDGGNAGPSGLNFSVDDYATYTALSGGVAAVSGGTAPTGIIASGQGFFIEAINSGTVTFNNAMRVTTGNDDFFRAVDRIWLNFENDYGAFSQILITFSEEATNGYDRLYDGKRLDAGSYVSFFTMIDDVNYAIQGRESFSGEDVIDLGFKNLVEGENEYKISIDNIEGILRTTEVLLVDKLLDKTHDLNVGEYRFSSEQGVFKDRFALLLKSELPEDPLTEDELMIVKLSETSLQFSTKNDANIANIQLFDLLGRLLYDIDLDEETKFLNLENQLDQTIFITKATLTNGKVLTKKGLK